MHDDLKRIERSAVEEIGKAENLDALEKLRIEFLGRERGALNLILRGLKNLPAKERAEVGAGANELRTKVESLLEAREKELKKSSLESALKKEWLDVTRPGKKPERGHLHPITKVIREIKSIFAAMGFDAVDGPEVETEYYNFDALNIPKNHPARDMWDTFWIKGLEAKLDASETRKIKRNLRLDLRDPLALRLLLRAHTSSMQVRYMEAHNPPFGVIFPGRVYRYEATDAAHETQFYQLEGMMIDKDISIANFKYVIQHFFSRLFGKELKVRLRPSAYFPFVEPNFEVDISCVVCGGKGCPACKKSGWVEIAGAGMIHPAVFKNAGYNPKDWQGFAFGMGIDRIAMMKYKIPDVRLFHSGDLRFLKQF